MFAITLVTSLKISLHRTAVLLAASLFGMAIEFFFVHTTGSYKFGDFWVTIFGLGTIPLEMYDVFTLTISVSLLTLLPKSDLVAKVHRPGRCHTSFLEKESFPSAACKAFQLK